MSQIKIAIIEDEMVIADTIALALKKLGYTSVPQIAANYKQAVNLLHQNLPDLLLLDINLGSGKDGIDFAEYVRSNYHLPIIFLTANSDAATVERAKKVKPNSYLVKPFNKNELFAAIEIAVDNFYNSITLPLNESIMVKDGYDYIKVLINDIIYIESDQNYAVLNFNNRKKIMVRSTLTEMLDRLPKQKFVKINRGTIININCLTTIKTDKILIGETEFSINKIARDELLALM